MKNPEQFHKTLGILVKAYMNDTLKHGDCAACAVGNIIAANGFKFDDDSYSYANTDWLRYIRNMYDNFDHKLDSENAKKQIDKSGYTALELYKIEEAFEKSWLKYNCEDKMHGGLMAVVEALGEIHEVSKEQVQESKLLFIKP
jgi:hypothetical protein